MVFQSCPGIAQVEAIYEEAGQVCENVYHVTNGGSSAYTVDDLAGLENAVAGWETASAKAYRSSNTGMILTRARDLGTADGHEHQTTRNINGTDSGNVIAQNVTVALRAGTGLAGRSNRGRTFWIGLTDAHASNGEIAEVWLGNVVEAMNALITAVVEGTGFELCVLSRRADKALRSVGIGIPIISYSATDTYVDSQRRRLPGHNRHH